LNVLYKDGWRCFETDRATRSICIFSVDTPNPHAVERLLEEGFAIVREHWHDYGEFVYCDCREHRAQAARRCA
jgi:hypothetical protein